MSAAGAPVVAGVGALSLVEAAKRMAARRAVDEYVRSGAVVGVGSGSTIVYAVERMGERAREEGLALTCIPTSFQAVEVSWWVWGGGAEFAPGASVTLMRSQGR
jgi:hypothetical protein